MTASTTGLEGEEEGRWDGGGGGGRWGMTVGNWSETQTLDPYLLKIAPQVLEGRSLVSRTTAVHVGTRVAGLWVVQRVDGYLPKSRVAGVRSWTGRD